MRYLPCCATLVVAIGAANASAQFNYYHSSTAGEGYQRGAAAVISAQGQRNVDNSQARINNQDAYSAAIDNSVKSVNAYWEKKDIYEQRQAQKDYETGEKRDRWMARHRLEPLSANEFDRTTGYITWPKVLEQPQYDQYRKTLDDLFKKRATAGALTSDDYMAATAASKEWRTMLTGQQSEYPQAILKQMVRFVLKVSNELDDNLS
ncbi:MAG: hypothetical protein WD851_08540 [Pirellulales bacterium]